MEHVLRIQNGQAVTLHTDAINLADLGKLTVRRASLVEFDEAGQEWTVTINGKVCFRNPIRAACLYWEREYFNAILAQGKELA